MNDLLSLNFQSFYFPFKQINLNISVLITIIFPLNKLI